MNKNIKRVPEIRFKDENGLEFGEWKEKKLGEVCLLKGGYAFKSSEFKNEGIPIIRISNISNKNNYIDLSNLVYHKKINNDENYIIQNGDLIIAMSGATTGKSSIYNLKNNAYLNQRVGLFKANLDKLNYGFLIQYIFSDFFTKELDGILVAGAQPNISGKDIEKFNVSLPSLPEQQKIASFLSSIDEKIENIKEKKKSFEGYKKGVMQKIFSQEFRFRDENGGEFREWEEKKLGEFITENKKSSFNVNSSSNKGDYPFFTSGDKVNRTDTYLVEGLNLFMNDGGVPDLKKYNGKCSYSNHTFSFKPDEKNNGIFLYYVLKSRLNEINTKFFVGSGLKNLSKSDFKLFFKVKLPSYKEQEKIADFLSGIDEKIENINLKLQKSEEFKKGLLQGMFV